MLAERLGGVTGRHYSLEYQASVGISARRQDYKQYSATSLASVGSFAVTVSFESDAGEHGVEIWERLDANTTRTEAAVRRIIVNN